MATTTTPLLTVFEAAEYLAVLPARLKRWAKAGQVPCLILPDGDVRFAVADLESWVREQRTSAEGKENA